MWTCRARQNDGGLPGVRALAVTFRFGRNRHARFISPDAGPLYPVTESLNVPFVVYRASSKSRIGHDVP